MLDCDRSFETSIFKATPHEAGLLLALLGRELASAEGLIDGMLRVGLGVDAIAAYLGCARTTILDEISDRGIPIGLAQLDKPFRPRKNAWPLMDHTLFIVGWTCGVQIPALAELLGRSAGSLYGKRRRIGLPTRRVATAEGRRKPKQPKKSSAASATTPDAASLPATTKRKRTRRQPSPEAVALPTLDATSETLQTAPDVSLTTIVSPARLMAETAPTTEEIPAPQVNPGDSSLATSHSDRPSEPQIEGPLAGAKEKNQRTSRQAKPLTSFAETHPAWHAATEDFKANWLPHDVAIIGRPAIEKKIRTAVGILGGMSKAAIKAATGLTLPCIGSHVSRMHLSSKGATSSTFDRQRYEDALKVLTPKAGGVSRCLIFRAPGDHRPNVVDESNERRRKAAIGTIGKIAKHADEFVEEKLKHEPWWTGIEVRNGVRLSAVPSLSKQFEFTI
ncbi:hypothetical protein FM996_20470 [Methylosinus sporium]|uniref:Uncharacterized protein n=1 Tax=Methylosinus sporium TaxID=428 RepID=A0A549SD31_METSR|nr:MULTISPECIES: hypothetical protein [Methylosinus]TRL24680.1 hypothetical protein FM996_20470 [Methylosinus sporium]